ncbi:MAG: NB-ARC domain-containing protein [Ilumatobacteraceae bacterium]
MTMTFLMTDIEGSTRRWEESPEMSELVDRHFAVLRDAVTESGGEVFATMGDGIAAAFTSAEAAVHAAIAAQREMPAVGLAVRMGIHTGEVERVDDDFRGRPVNRAARIMAVGHGGQILLSNLSASLIRSGPSPVELTDLGTHRLRDLTDPEQVWQVLHPDLESAFPTVRGLDTYSTNLPIQRSSLIGREHDVARVIGLVQRHRIVTLTGVGGVGKTRLAVQSAADLLSRFANVWFVELASVADPDDVADAIARTLGASALTDSLAAAGALLCNGRNLLVIDNCEHVVESAAEVIDALTAECHQLSVIATSREALDIDGEHVVAVRSLDSATTAVELFRQRAEAAGADLLQMERPLLEQICRRLDGIPLAIELAAARAATLGVPALVDALDDRFNLLSGGRRRALDRHGTMRTTIDWSYRLLAPDEQRLFQWLALFSNGFELDAARHVAHAMGIDELAATEHVASLVHKSMISPEPSAHGVRYRMLETMRAYALEVLEGTGARLDAATAHAEWVATLTDLPWATPCTAAVERSSIRLEREDDNWRDAIMFAARTGSADLAGRLCGPPVAYFLLGRHDLADLVTPLLELCDAERHPVARRAVLTSLVTSASGAASLQVSTAWADEVKLLDEADLSGVGYLMKWMSLAWAGEFEAAIAECVAGSLDTRIDVTTRDKLLGIAVLGRFSLLEATDDPEGLIERALSTVERSEVALQRTTCRLGAAWGLATTDPDRSLALVRQALVDIPNVPALTRMTLPGSASRLLTRLAPGLAAQGLLEQLDAIPARRTFVDLIPVFYGAALLHRVDHPSADTALATLTMTRIAPFLSMMDFVDLARQASAAGSMVSLIELEASVRSGLADIVAAAREEAVAHAGH